MPLSRMLLVLALMAALLGGWQRSTALACATGDTPCRDHCAIMADSCASSCPTRLAPAPELASIDGPPPRSYIRVFDQPTLIGRSISPDTGPPRLVA